jgi:hypothetical protein
MRQTGLDRPAIDAAFAELETAGWVQRDAEVLWTTTCHPLLRDPTSGLNTVAKRSGVLNLLTLLPRESVVVRKFKRFNRLGRSTPRTRGGTTGGTTGEERERERDRKPERERERTAGDLHRAKESIHGPTPIAAALPDFLRGPAGRIGDLIGDATGETP